jgi:hypothetical protein
MIGIALGILIILYAIAHISALFTSIYCFKYGINSSSVLGFFIMIFLGPFFWLYYAFSKDYCTSYYNISNN